MESTDSTKSSEMPGSVNGMNTKDKSESPPAGKRKRDDDEPPSPAAECGDVSTKNGNVSTEAASEPAESSADVSFQSADASGSAPEEAGGEAAAGPSRRSSRSGATPAATPSTTPGTKAGTTAGTSSAGAEKAESDSESTGLPEDEFLVEKILDYVRENKVDMFLIKWKGWGHAYNSWEPQDNLSCLEMMINFFKERELAHQNKRRKTEPSLAGEEYLKMFEEEHFHPTDEQLAEEFSRRVVGGQLKFKEKPKSLKAVHIEIEQFVRHNGVKAESMKALRKVRLLKEQLLQLRLMETRDRQLARLKQWEDDINALCSDSARITVENDVDLALPPENFIYKNDYVPGEGVVIPSDPVIGCECLACYPGTACCSQAAGATTAYTKTGKLRLQVGQPIYECNKSCRCGDECFNRVVQKGRKVKLAIFRTSNGCGWGVKALEAIKRGSFVVEYVGEVITNEEAERRGEKYDSVGVTYLFDLDFNDQVNLYTVDAAVHGNVSHFVNHSCEPNLVVYGMWSDCLDPNLPRLALFACRDILRGEQLYFDYNSPLGSNMSAKEIATPTTGGAVTAVTAVKRDATPPAGSQTPPRGDAAVPRDPCCSPTKSPRRPLGRHPSARTTCKCGAKACRRYLF